MNYAMELMGHSDAKALVLYANNTVYEGRFDGTAMNPRRGVCIEQLVSFS